MINLLLPKDRKIVRVEYRRRLLLVGGLLLFGLELIVVIVLGSFAFILSLRRGEIVSQVMVAKERFATEEFVSIRQAVEKANASVLFLNSSTALPDSVSGLFQILIKKKSEQIHLLSLVFSSEGHGRIEVEGKSDTRDALLVYLESLGNDPHFANVESPIRNIIKEREVDFRFAVVGAKPDQDYE